MCRGDDDECCDADGLVPTAVMAATISDGPYQLATQVLLVSTGMVIITILVTFRVSLFHAFSTSVTVNFFYAYST